MATTEGFIPLNGSAGNSAPVGGRRRSAKKLRMVKKKTVRRMLKKMGLKMRGGEDKTDAAAPAPAPEAPAMAPKGGKKARRSSSVRSRRNSHTFPF